MAKRVTKSLLLVLLVACSGCCAYRQSLPELLAPDGLSIGASVKMDDPDRIDQFSVQLRWDLK